MQEQNQGHNYKHQQQAVTYQTLQGRQHHLTAFQDGSGYESKSLKQVTPNNNATFKVVGYSKHATPMMTTTSNKFNYGGVASTADQRV